MTKQLWAPWRLEYMQAADEQEGCVFCLAQARTTRNRSSSTVDSVHSCC
jgi:hypothetical protein